MDVKKTRGPPFYIFRHCAAVENSQFSFFFNFFDVSKGPPIFFHIFQQTGVSKCPKGVPFTILKTLRFLSLRYSADIGRSRLVENFRGL